jgi:hypothetical protein
MLASPASAHVPAVEGSVGFEEAAEPGDAAVIGGPEKSRAVYGYLAGGRGDAYAFTVEEPVARTVGVIVPAYAEHEAFRPTLVLEEDGILIERARDEGERMAEFEPFSLTSFWKGPSIAHEFEPGRNYVVQIEPGAGDEASGRYVLVLSGPEEFSGSDTLDTLRGLPRIWFGAYGGAPARWNTLALVPIGIVIIVLGMLVYAGTRVVRSSRARGR